MYSKVFLEVNVCGFKLFILFILFCCILLGSEIMEKEIDLIVVNYNEEYLMFE